MSESPYFIGVGDIHEQPERIRDIPGIRDCLAVIISGDLTTHGGAAAAERVLSVVGGVAPRVLAQVGNMDGPSVHKVLMDAGVNIHVRGMDFSCRGCPASLGIMGVGTSTPTPFGTPNEHSETRLEAWLEEAHAQVPACDNLLLVAHDPPYGTAIDRLTDGRHVGCRAVRAFVERVQPQVCLSGHIHESPGVDALGRTVLVNPGPLAAGGYARIEFNDRVLTATLERF